MPFDIYRIYSGNCMYKVLFYLVREQTILLNLELQTYWCVMAFHVMFLAFLILTNRHDTQFSQHSKRLAMFCTQYILSKSKEEIEFQCLGYQNQCQHALSLFAQHLLVTLTMKG